VLNYQIADWRDPKAYPPGQGTRMRRWAWEFLRRNPEYHADYDRWLRNASRDKRPGPDEDLSSHACDPPSREGETLAEYEARMAAEGHQWQYTSMDFVLRRKYHIAMGALPAPEDDVPPIFDASTTGRFLFGPQRELHWSDGLAADQAIYVFDLSKSLEMQCKRALKVMQAGRERFAKKNPALVRDRRVRSGNYQSYLRVLDATAAGVKDNDIAAVLLPRLENTYANGYLAAQTIRNYRKAATELRDGGYRFLPKMESQKERPRNK
jgi:hypothetical protein